METFKQVFSIGRETLISGIKYVYSDINPSTLTGAIDVIVIEQPDGTFKCGPFHVRFGKIGVLKPADKIVDIQLNGQFLENLRMKLGSAGEAYFVEPVDSSVKKDIDLTLTVSPIQSDTEDFDEVDLSQRALSAENIHTNTSEQTFTRRRLRRSKRNKVTEIFVEHEEEESVGGGYNSDGAVDRLSQDNIQDRNMTWEWGDFPLENHSATSIKDEISSQVVDQPKNEADKKINNTNQSTEVYLEDISKPEVSEEMKNEYIYLSERPTRSRTVSMTIDCGYKSSGEMSPASPANPELLLSLCGGGADDVENDDEENFHKNLVNFEDFLKNPDEILKNPRLMVKLNGRRYSWAVAAPILVSLTAFGAQLPQVTLSGLQTALAAKKVPPRRSAWFSWGRGRKEEPAAVAVTTETTVTSEKRIYLKKIRLSSEEIVALGLLPGRNEVTFSMTTKYQGTTKAHAAIYLWHWSDKLVISDVDGTITKSDVLGHVLPILGRDWTQQNVVRLFSSIAANQYRFVYLSARAIGQSGRTRTFLHDVTQDQVGGLPDGPILLSPTSLFQSLHRELIAQKPENFKIPCLLDLGSLFPSNVSTPLYAGFGNRPNDVISYRAAGIDDRRIFTVNRDGHLKNEFCALWSTNYGDLADLVDLFFEHCDRKRDPGTYGFNDVNFWFQDPTRIL